MKGVYRLFFTCACFLLANIYVSAQLYKVDLNEKVSKAPLIVEGKVIAQKSFWNDAHTMIYTANTIKVFKLFKGTLADKTIDIVTQGGSIDNRAVIVSDLLHLDINKVGIFFCQPNELSLKSPISKKQLFDVYSSDQGFLRYDEKNNVAYAPFAKYQGIENNLHKLIQQQTGKAVQIIDASYSSKGSGTNVAYGTAAISLTSFAPLSVHAGTLNDPSNNTITINGSGFGATPSGACAVKFKDANNDNTDPDYNVPYTSPYLISWSNTKIIVSVPGRAATGKIAVVASDGSIATSSSDLDVFYSVLNAEFDFTAQGQGKDTAVISEPRLMNTNNSGGYTLVYSTSTAGNGKNLDGAPEKATFQRALTTWKEQVGVNFTEGGTTTVQKVTGDDNFNVIMFDNNNTGIPHLAAGVLATTYGWFSICYNSSPFKVYNAQKTGFDMVIRNNGVSSGSTAFITGPCFPSSEIDLEMVVLHELGHALDLGHINDDLETSNDNNALFINPSKLMHYAITNYVNRRSLDASAYQGALYTVKKQGNSYSTCIATEEMNPLSYIVIPNDNCPSSFPSSATPDGTTVNFDLVHATSNKLSDPQFTAINCGVDNGQFVTNNAFFAMKTSSAATSLKLTIGNYANTPASQNSCIGQGIRLAVYDVNTCPAGQNYPQPIACATFSGNGTLPEITNLESNHDYLLYFDGLRNTKANFDAVINGDGTVPTGEFSMKVYPNPVRDDLTIELTDTISGKYQFIIYDMLGRAITTQSYDVVAGNQKIYMHLINVAGGIYILKVINGKGDVISKQKIMKGK